MAVDHSIVDRLETVLRSSLAIQSVCNAAYGQCPRPDDLVAELAFGVQVMSERLIEQIELLKNDFQRGVFNEN